MARESALDPAAAGGGAAALARGLGVNGKTVSRYFDLFVDLLLVRRLAPLHANAGKRLVRSPKVLVRDSGLVHSLLGVADGVEVVGAAALTERVRAQSTGTEAP